jgi:hypothetical protein
MNPQPSEYVGHLCALAFIGVFLFYAYQAYTEGRTIDLKNFDYVTIGYVEEPVKCATVASFESQQLYLDCIEALYTLGFKKSEAKKKAKLIFSSIDPQPSSVQEFLSIALKK